MVGAFVTFRYGSEYDQGRLEDIAATARGAFEGMHGLRCKAFTINAEQRQAVNFYVWESLEVAQAFFTAKSVARITLIYGVRPSIEFVQIATIVENHA